MADSPSSGIRARIERAFEAWGRIAFRRPLPIVVVTGIVSALLIAQLPRLETDNSTDSFLRPNDPVRVAYDEFRREFGRDERISIAVEAPDLFAPAFLERLRALHLDLEREVGDVDDLTSMINARDTRGDEQGLIVEELLADWPESSEELESLRERVLSNPLYRNTLISGDARVTTLSIRLVTYESRDEDATGGFDEAGPATFLSEQAISNAVRVVYEVAGRYDAPDFRVRVAGGPVMSERLNTRMQEDMVVFTAWCIGAICLFLFLLFRRVAAVVLPLLVVGLSMLSTLGVMALAGGKLSIATQILPSLLLAVGVCDAVHIRAIYYQRLQAGSGREDAVAFTMGHSGLAIVMTSVTTAGGLGSFALGELKPVADLGVYAPFGVMFALVYTVVLLPALLALVPTSPRRRPGAEDGSDRLSRVLVGMGDFAASYPWSVVSVALCLLLISGLGASFLRFSHDPMDWFPKSEPIREATLFMNQHLDGVNVVEILVRTGRENGAQDPELLRRLDAVRADAARIHQGPWHIGKTVSLADVVMEVHQALNKNRPEFHRIPDDRELVAQELLLFESTGSDDLEDFVDPVFSTARITMRVPWLDAIVYPKLLAELEERVRGILGEGVTLEVTGLVPVLSKTFRSMLVSMATSYIVALLVIAPLMVLLIGHFTRGLLSMIPNVTPVIVMLGFMGWSGTPVDGLTMMVGAIVIGLAVDDTIHFMHNFRRYYERTGDAREAIRMTLTTTGRALLVTSLVLAAGFFTFAGAYMINARLFGLLAGGAVLVAFISNVVLSSSLMVLATRRAERAAVP